MGLRHILGLQEMGAAEINMVLEKAAVVKAGEGNLPSLVDKTMVNLFYEPSTRTRVSFELAGKALGMGVVNVAAEVSSVVKGESFKDTLLTLKALGIDVFVIRHPMAGAPWYAAELLVDRWVINAGDGMHEHPTQGLLDLFTIKEHKGKVGGLKVVIVGDLLHSRVARSNIWGLTKLGAKVMIAGPATLVPEDIEKMGLEGCYYGLDEVIKEVDVVYLLRIQLEREKAGLFPSLSEYHKFWGLTYERLQKCKPDVLVMHPGPMNRGIEIDSAVVDSGCAVITEQVSNGLVVRKALLALLLEDVKK